MQIIPTNPVPSQTLNVSLNGQSVRINLFTFTSGLLADVLLNGTLIAASVLCYNNNRIVRAAYTGFVGDLSITDTQGDSDPTYDGLGSRYQLIYLEEADL